MSESESLLDSNPFVRARVAKAYAEALAEALQEALVIAVESRFPALLDLAQERAKLAQQPDALKVVLRGINSASSEEIARAFLNSCVYTTNTFQACQWAVVFKEGQITVQEPDDTSKTSAIYAITGGTGSYTGARGWLEEISRKNGTEYEDFFHLT